MLICYILYAAIIWLGMCLKNFVFQASGMGPQLWCTSLIVGWLKRFIHFCKCLEGKNSQQGDDTHTNTQVCCHLPLRNWFHGLFVSLQPKVFDCGHSGDVPWQARSSVIIKKQIQTETLAGSTFGCWIDCCTALKLNIAPQKKVDDCVPLHMKFLQGPWAYYIRFLGCTRKKFTVDRWQYYMILYEFE